MSDRIINADWTIREWHNAKRNNIVKDEYDTLGIVIKTAGTIDVRFLWVENIFGELIWENVNSNQFTICDFETSKAFHLEYKINHGWKIGRIFKLKNSDHPLMLIGLEFNYLKNAMEFVFKDLLADTYKTFKTFNEELLEHIPEETYEMLECSNIEDSTSSLRYELILSYRDRGSEYHNGWSVSGSPANFGEKESLLLEIDKIIARLRIRRIASVLSRTKNIIKTQFALTDENEVYITPFKEDVGQPAYFNSYTDAALAISFLGQDVCKQALQIELDQYII